MTSLIPLLFLGSITTAPLASDPNSAPISAPSSIYSLSLRTGRETCWVQYRIDSKMKICITRLAWQYWIKNSSSINCPIIWSSGHSKWKVSSPLKNSLINPKKSPKNPTKNKDIQLIRTFTDINCNPGLFQISPFLRPIEIHREKISELFRHYDQLGILRSLILNEGSNQNSLTLLRRLGFVHLVTTTGIHLYAFSDSCNHLIGFFFRTCKLPVKFGLILSRIISFILCTYLWLLSGARAGMLRPALVILIRKFSEILGFQWTKASPLLFSLTIEGAASMLHLKLDHSGSHFSGRWIYALAVGGSLFFSECFSSTHIATHLATRFSPHFAHRLVTYLVTHLATHLGLAVGSWILVAIWEIWEVGSISLATPLLSLITLPAICILIYPLTLFSVFLNLLDIPIIPNIALQTLSQCLSKLIISLTHFAMTKGNLWIIPKWTFILALPIATLFLILFVIFKRPVRTYGSFFLILFLMRFLTSSISFQPTQKKQIQAGSQSNLPSSQASRVEQLDVGQGDAALVIGSQVGLIDTGPEKAISDEKWLQIFAQRQIKKLDWIAFTHLDEDHAGGIFRLSRLIPIRCISSSQAELETPRGIKFLKHIKRIQIDVSNWNSDCVPYPTLAPLPPRKNHRQRNSNMGAIWIPLQSNGFYLSAGDANSEDEVRIGHWARALSKDRKFPRILKVSHHGSRYSTTEEFLNSVQPTEAWISVGQGNRYGHPSVQTLMELMKLKIPIYRTDQKGSISSK